MSTDLERYQYESDPNLACTGNARRTIEQLLEQGVTAYAYWVPEREPDTGHVFVIAQGQRPDDLPLNLPARWRDRPRRLTVEDVLRRGKDCTQDMLEGDWSEFG
ncbi:MAG: hypothetical protein Q7S76_03240 [bacterium]|nr:hypothetical protein [bacterium]